MMPIVNGLETDYGEKMAFVRLNAAEGDGKQVFQQLRLPGHPSYVIFSADGKEEYRAFGIVEDAQFREIIANLLQNKP
jgi:hypothetical protein